MSDDESLERPETGAGDIAHTAAAAGLSAIPVVGGPAAAIFSAVIVPPLQKRRDDWIESIAERLKDLEDRVDDLDLADLKDNEGFITTVMHASQAAIRNHDEEKLEALRNAILNAALPTAPDDDLQLMFLDYVDRLTPWHLRILAFFDDPKGWAERNDVTFSRMTMGAPAHILEEGYPELADRKEFYAQVVKDLFARGLMNTDSLDTTMSEQGIYARRTSAMGREFLQFVTAPDV